MKIKSQSPLETVLFGLGIVGIIAAGITAAILRFTGFHFIGRLTPCMLYTLLGIPCPGCGGTRAVEYLLEGHPVQSFLAHPLVLYAVSAYLYFMAAYAYVVFGRRETFRMERLPFGQGILVGAAVLVLVQWVFKLFLW